MADSAGSKLRKRQTGKEKPAAAKAAVESSESVVDKTDETATQGKSIMRITIWRLGVFVVVPYMVAMLLLAAYQRSLIYPKFSHVADLDSAGGKVHLMPGTGNITALGLHFPVQDPAAPTVVYFHGNGDQLGWGAAFLGPRFVKHGCAMFGVEYPGYGEASGGPPSEANIYATAELAIMYLTTPAPNGLGVPQEKVVLVGQGIGGGVAMEMATRGLGSKLVLLSTFTSILKTAHGVLGVLTNYLPVSLIQPFVPGKFDNAKKADSVAIPTRIIHGDSDTVVPHSMSQVLNSLIPCSELQTLKDRGHDDIFSERGNRGDAVIGGIAEFAKSTEDHCAGRAR